MPSSRPGLTRQRILDAALAIIDRDGLDAISMRRLGEELGVEAMSLYHHVASKADILDGVFERILGQMPPSPRGGSWRDALRDRATAMRAALRAHPNAMVLFATRPAVTPGSLAHVETALARLHEGGLTPEAGLAALHVIAAFVVGHTLSSYGPRRIEERTNPRYGRVSAASLPRVHGALRLLPPRDPEAEFALGLDALIDRLAHAGPPARRDKATTRRDGRRRSR